MNIGDEVFPQGPGGFQDFLNSRGVVGDIYGAMRKEDLGELVMASLAGMKETRIQPLLVKQAKCKVKSTEYRNIGNEAYRGGRPQTALENYNRALMFAPQGTAELVLAFSNRSALFFKCEQFKACIKDIDKCYSLGCPEHIKQKLQTRRHEASHGIWLEELTSGIRHNKFVREFFQFKERKNPQIPCASLDVGVIKKPKGPVIVAARDVKIGKLLAVETAFVSTLELKLLYKSCHYCHTMSLNLIPCENCCFVLFCNEQCRDDAARDHHRFECPLMEIYDSSFPMQMPKLGIRGAIKLRNQFASWPEFINATTIVGRKRARTSQINEIYDGNNKSSMLNFRDDSVYVFGPMHNNSFKCAVLMFYMQKLTSFFPEAKDEREAALRAFGRVVLFLSLHGGPTLIPSSLTVVVKRISAFCDVANFGLFPFLGKLQHNCKPNVILLGLNNKIAMVALRPIAAGEPIISAYLGHWLDNSMTKDFRRTQMFKYYRIACNCQICNGEWEQIERTAEPTPEQMESYKEIRVEEAIGRYDFDRIQEYYTKSCRVLDTLKDIPFSKQYRAVFKLFRKCLLDVQSNHTPNFILDCTTPTCIPNVTNIN